MSFDSPYAASGSGTPQSIALALAEAQTLLQRATTNGLEKTIGTVLRMIGQAHGADRAFLFQIKDMVFVENTHQWAAPGIKSIQADLKETPYFVGEVFWAAFRRDGLLLLSDVSSVPAGSDMHKMVIQQEIQSIIAAPLWSAAEIIGFVGLDYCRAPRTFDAQDGAVMKSLAASLGAALECRRLGKQRDQLVADLQTAQDRISAMVKALPELLLETDHDGIVIGFHQSPPLTLALNPAEVIGLPPESFLPVHVARIARKAMAQVDASGWSETHGYSIMIDGQRKHFALHATQRSSASPIRSQGYLFVVRDVTESQQQAKHLHKLARVAKLSSNLILLTDADRCITWMNPAAVARTGVSLEAALGRPLSDVFRLNDAADATLDEVREKIDRFGQFRKDVPAISWSGIPYWIDLNVQPLIDAESQVEGFMVVASDVSLHKLAEARALRERVNTMDLSEDSIAISQPDGSLTYMNPALRRIMHVPADAPLEGLTWQKINPASVNEQFAVIFPELFAHGQWSGEISFPQTDAPDRYFDLSVWVQDDGSFLSIARETTARKAVEKHNALLREQLQVAQSRQQISQLAGGLAHDIFNLMAVIMHAAEVLKPQINPGADQSLGRIESATAQVLSLAKNMSKLGRRHVQHSVMDIRPIVKQATDLLRPSLGGDAVLILSMPQDPIHITCDRTELMQVLLNLLINARDALSGASAQIHVRVKVNDPTEKNLSADVGTILSGRSYVSVDVCDTGVGLTEKLKSEMFDPYFTTKGENGTGLGMSIVSGILLGNQAALKVQSEPGQGTCMQVLWPVAAPTDTRQSNLNGHDQRPSVAGLNVLLLDDDDDNLAEISHSLTNAGAEFVSCASLEDALEALADDPGLWHAIIANADTAGDAASALADRLRSAHATLPIALTTSNKQLHFATKYTQNENLTVLYRPFEASVLLEFLHHAQLRIQT